MLKRIIAIFTLTAVLAAGCMTAVRAADAEEGGPQEAELLSVLDILPSGFGAAEGGEVTRIQYVNAVARLMGMGSALSMLSEVESPFLDVPGRTDEANAVKLLAKQGIIGGNGAGQFYPDEVISVSEAVKILVSALGYEEEAQDKGGYPYGYLRVAVRLDLLGSGTEGPLTRGLGIHMLYQALEADVLARPSLRGLERISGEKGRTALNQYLNIGRMDGVVTANEETALGGEAPMKTGYLAIDGRSFVMEDGVQFAAEYLGYPVKAYYRQNEQAEASLVWVARRERKQLTLKAGEIDSFRDYVLRYYPEGEGRTREARIPLTAQVIYNRVFVESYTDEMMTPATGEVTLLDSDGDGAWDVVRIMDYKNHVVSNISENKEEIYTKFGPDKTLSLHQDNARHTALVNPSGFPIQLSSVKPDDVLSVAESVDKTVIRIVVCQERIEGEVTEAGSSGGIREISIDGESYQVSPQFSQTPVQVGDTGQFYLDIDGKIAYVTQASESNGRIQYAYFIGAAQTNSLSGTLSFQVILEDGTKPVLETADRVRLNGANVKSGDLADSRLLFNSSGGLIRQMARIGLNSQKKLSRIETAASGPEEGERLYISSQGSYKYRSSTATLGFRTFLNSGATKVFMAPESDSSAFMGERPSGFDLKDYYTGDSSFFANDKTYNCIVYNTRADGTMAEAVLVYRSVSIPSSLSMYSPFVVVDELARVLDEEGEECWQLSGFRESTPFTAMLAEDEVLERIIAYHRDTNTTLQEPHSLQKGDIIRYETNAEKLVQVIQLIYDESEDCFYGDSRSPTQFTADVAMNYGYAARRGASVSTHIFFGGIDPVTKERHEPDGTILPVDRFRMVLYDGTLREPELRAGAPEDVIDSASYGAGGSTLVYMTKVGEPTFLVVYNR